MSASMIPDTSFFRRPALRVAADLLGARLACVHGKDIIGGIITEVEAYVGPQDKASHAHRGQTPRNAPMFGPPGHWYIYLVYGMHWMLNIVTCAEGYPAAILIRGVGEWNGPGKLTRALAINDRFDAKLSSRQTGLWIEARNTHLPSSAIHRTKRIGVDYAEEWAEKPYRFLLSKKG